MLEFKNVSFRYSGETNNTVENLSFRLEQGAFVSVVGASGCGKSTLFRLINKLEGAQSGEILINGRNIAGQSNYSGYMPQKDLLFPWRTIGKNLALPLEIQGISKGEIERRIEAILADVGLLPQRDKYPAELSGGMRQRVSFARTLLTGSDLLLLDEPFSALDSLTKISLQEWLLDQWGKSGKTIFFITHDVEEALFLSKQVLVIDAYPVSSFKVFDVPLPYPRKRADLKDPAVTELKEKIINQIRQKVKA